MLIVITLAHASYSANHWHEQTSLNGFDKQSQTECVRDLFHLSICLREEEEEGNKKLCKN